MKFALRNPISGLTHLIGAFLSIVGLCFLLLKALPSRSPVEIAAFAIFGVSLIVLYTSSSLYHLLPLSEPRVRQLRRVDHMMIYVLITGTYVPICLVALKGVWGRSLLAGVLVTMIAGIVMKSLWLDAPRWLSTAIYVIMGWFLIVAIAPLLKALPAQGIAWLLAGGLFYTIGAVIYGIKKPNISKLFGFHELWHLFVMAGSFCHFWMIYAFVSAI